MHSIRAWSHIPDNFRQGAMKIIAEWIAAGASGSLVGLPGSGKSNLLGFLSHRPDVLATHLPAWAWPVAPIPVDLNNLPDYHLSTLYRVILRSFYEVRFQLSDAIQSRVIDLYEEHKSVRDPFVTQSALRELLLQCGEQNIRVVLVLDSFEKFCAQAPLQMPNTLRGLRDSFKDTLSYIVGMRHEPKDLIGRVDFGELYELLDLRVHWIGAFNRADMRLLIRQETAGTRQTPSQEEIEHLARLTGQYPALLKAACHWWLIYVPQAGKASTWPAQMLRDPGIRFRLSELWSALTQEERFVVSEVQKLSGRPGGPVPLKAFRNFGSDQVAALADLVAKGICAEMEEGWRIRSRLFARYVAGVDGWGRVWYNEQTGEVQQGPRPLRDLTPLERAVLEFFIAHPQVRHTKSDIIYNAWPDEVINREVVTDDSLYQIIRGLRRKIEPLPSNPCYIMTWRGQPEGGYQFFPKGLPAK